MIPTEPFDLRTSISLSPWTLTSTVAQVHVTLTFAFKISPTSLKIHMNLCTLLLETTQPHILISQSLHSAVRTSRCYM